MKSRRGVSAVVGTVLIILLVIAAVVIVWGFVRPLIQDAGEDLTVDCISMDVEVVSCVSKGAATGLFDVTYQWKAGDDLSGVKVALYDDSGENVVADVSASNVPASVLEQGTHSIHKGSLSGTTFEATVTGVAGTTTCQESAKVTCADVTP